MQLKGTSVNITEKKTQMTKMNINIPVGMTANDVAETT